MLPDLVAAAALVLGVVFAVRAVRLHQHAEAFRYGCLWAEDLPGRGVPEERMFTPEGQLLRRRARRTGWLALSSVAAAIWLASVLAPARPSSGARVIELRPIL